MDQCCTSVDDCPDVGSGVISCAGWVDPSTVDPCCGSCAADPVACPRDCCDVAVCDGSVDCAAYVPDCCTSVAACPSG